MTVPRATAVPSPGGPWPPCERPNRAATVATMLRRYSSSTDTTFVSEPDAPAASVTVAVIVKLRGRMMTYVWLTVNEPWLVLLPVLVEPSPQSIRYDHGPLPFASLKLKLVEYSRPVTAVSSGPALTTGALFGVVQVTE